MERTYGNNRGGAAAAKGAGASDSDPTSEAAKLANILATVALMSAEVEDPEDEAEKEELDRNNKELAAALYDLHEGTYVMGEDNQKTLTRRIAAVGLAALDDDAVPPLNAKDFIAWLEENRPPKCKHIGWKRYWAMLEYDIENHKNGYDGSYVPGLREDAREKVKAWVVARAKSNERPGNAK